MSEFIRGVFFYMLAVLCQFLESINRHRTAARQHADTHFGE